jgi:hypothetical protein
MTKIPCVYYQIRKGCKAVTSGAVDEMGPCALSYIAGRGMNYYHILGSNLPFKTK